MQIILKADLKNELIEWFLKIISCLEMRGIGKPYHILVPHVCIQCIAYI